MCIRDRGNLALTKSLDKPKVNRERFFKDLDNMTFTQIADKYILSTPKMCIRDRFHPVPCQAPNPANVRLRLRNTPHCPQRRILEDRGQYK